MPHFEQFISDTARVRATADTKTPIPAVMNLVQHAIPNCCQTSSVPSMAMDAEGTATIGFGYADNAPHSTGRGADASVNGDVLTSRSVSPSSSFSRSDTLVDLSDAGSTTTVGDANPSVAERRLKFKEEFELADNMEELSDTKAKDKPSTGSTDRSGSPPATKSQKSTTSGKNAKAKGRKKSYHSGGLKFDLCSCNVYTGGNVTGKIGSTILDGGNGRKAILGGPSVASGIVGCTVM
ncbi:hypothetical protein MMC32_002950 [Xylographa parallela]|nr:hypothetical protein [Xylographa parallela]